MPAQSKVQQPPATNAGPPPVYKPVRKYKGDEINIDLLVARAEEILRAKPFRFQLEVAAAVLRGEDVIVDVGTGCGKTLCFTLSLLLEATDIAMIVSPLSALMVDQAQSAKIPTVAVCSETLSRLGADQVYADIVSGKFQQVIVSPEIATSVAFRKSTLSKPAFTSRLRCVCIDEAHCISLWGGSFRPDYADLGLLRGRVPSNVPFVVASATLPTHILDDVRTKLGLSKSATHISLTNARPNVALSCRTMQHPEESKADLRFLIRPGASQPADIPVTLVYCNQRLTCEDACDSLRRWARDEGIPDDCIAFYHAKIGQAQKRHLEERLRKGEIRVLFCTDPVGMGCDMRNIERVILWGLPPSFCALVQRAGRATRDFTKLGEAILIVPSSVIKNGVSEEDINTAIGGAAQDAEPENRGLDAAAHLLDQGIELTSAREEVVVAEGGVRAGRDSDEEDGEPGTGSRVSITIHMHRKIWDQFFDNDSKEQLEFPENTTYQPLPGMRCCDNCEPRLFEVEEIKLDKLPGLKRGRKKEMNKELADLIRIELMDWREDYLLDKIYPGTTTISAGTVLGDDVIEQLVKERVTAREDLGRHTRWAFGFLGSALQLSEHGEALFGTLQRIYEVHDAAVEAERERIANLPPLRSEVGAASFYAGTTRKTRNTRREPRDEDEYTHGSGSSRGRGDGVLRRSARNRQSGSST
ncbi:P-loop containing nucleoside triphosphate hydrolase protein [Mycena vitilis]|nr:P-loop containing nucleoside triphosphate hydrolase protein [Mycena vitilis]KAJ6492738.1 P-loop containing nucleoside triphosphate hydrolase protein [Mycena vitilis]